MATIDWDAELRGAADTREEHRAEYQREELAAAANAMTDGFAQLGVAFIKAFASDMLWRVQPSHIIYRPRPERRRR